MRPDTRRWLLVLSLTVMIGVGFVVPTSAQVGCCICGDFNANPQCFRGVNNCDVCSEDESEKTFIPNDPHCAYCSDAPELLPSHEVRPNCCVHVEKIGGKISACRPITLESECVTQAFDTNRREYYAQNCQSLGQCASIGEVYTPADIDPTKDPVLVKFIPSLTIPGSSIFNEGVPVIVTGRTMGEYIAALYVFFVGVAGILSTVFIMYGGVRYVISTGNPSQIQGAKDTIMSALVGLLIAVASYIILLTINPNLVQFDGLTLTHIKPIVDAEIQTGTEKKSGYVVTTNINQFDRCIVELASASDESPSYDPAWLKALMLVESGGNPRAKSSAGACGLVQLLPSTAEKYKPGVTCVDLYNPGLNLSIANQHYRDLLEKTCPFSAKYNSGISVKCFPEKTKCENGSHDYANAAYNGGERANCSSLSCDGLTWWECGVNTGYAETRDYVIKVRAAYEKIIASNASTTDTKYDWDMNTPTCAELAQSGN